MTVSLVFQRAAFGRAEGRHATAPDPTGGSAAERARIGGNSTAASTGPAAARDERATSAVGDRNVGDTDNAFSRDHAGHATREAWERQARNGAIARARSKTGDTIIAVSRGSAGDTRRQCHARNVRFAHASCNDAVGGGHARDVNAGGRRTCQTQTAAVANAGCKAGHTNNAFSRDHAWHAIACRQARNANASARWKTSDSVIAADAGQAGHGLAFDAARQRCKACNAAATSSRRTFGATACKARCASGCRCERSTIPVGAQACSTAAKGMPAREEDGCGQWPASL